MRKTQERAPGSGRGGMSWDECDYARLQRHEQNRSHAAVTTVSKNPSAPQFIASEIPSASTRAF